MNNKCATCSSQGTRSAKEADMDRPGPPNPQLWSPAGHGFGDYLDIKCAPVRRCPLFLEICFWGESSEGLWATPSFNLTPFGVI